MSSPTASLVGLDLRGAAHGMQRRWDRFSWWIPSSAGELLVPWWECTDCLLSSGHVKHLSPASAKMPWLEQGASLVLTVRRSQ